jgi:hypothetical protein
MIHAFHYEPQGQRQRFEPREPQENDLGQMHLHFSLDLHLNLGARLRRASRLFLQEKSGSSSQKVCLLAWTVTSCFGYTHIDEHRS